MKIHFIAIGGALMHNLALALQKQGHQVSGSDDEIYEPSRSRLSKAGLLPEKMGWDAGRITTNIDVIILGMHARKNNPELLKAQELGLEICSYPEFIYRQSQDKLRIVVGGSHGKTSTTSMIMHVLQDCGLAFDYAVGAQLEGFDHMVQLSDAPIIVIEGDEYLSSPLDARSKFLHYKPHIAILTGIAWDHINVFPTFEDYTKQFQRFITSIQDGGSLIYYRGDKLLTQLSQEAGEQVQVLGYKAANHLSCEGRTWLRKGYDVKEEEILEVELQIFGQHNLENLQAARLVCRELGLSDQQFFASIQGFKGAAKRLELLEDKPHRVYKDFAHAPSKVRATVKSVKAQFGEQALIAALELHTFSSLNKDFIAQYKDSLNKADYAYVYFSEHTLKMKKLPDLSTAFLKEAFNHPNLEVFTSAEELQARLIATSQQVEKATVLLMSSGTWGGLTAEGIAANLRTNQA